MGRANQPVRGLNLSPFVQGATQANAITASSGGGFGKALQFGVSTFIDAKQKSDAKEERAAARTEQKRQFDLQFGMSKERLGLQKAELAVKKTGYQLQRQSSLMTLINKQIGDEEGALNGIAMASGGELTPEQQQRAQELQANIQKLRKQKTDLQAAMTNALKQQTDPTTPGRAGTEISQNEDGTLDVNMGLSVKANIAGGTARIKAPIGQKIVVAGEEMDVTDPRARSIAINQRLQQYKDLKKSPEWNKVLFSDKIAIMRKELALTQAADQAALELQIDTAENGARASVQQSMDATLSKIPPSVLSPEEAAALRKRIMAKAMPGALVTARSKMKWAQADDNEVNQIVASAVSAEMSTNPKMTQWLAKRGVEAQRVANAVELEKTSDEMVADRANDAVLTQRIRAEGQVANEAALGAAATSAAMIQAEAEEMAEPTKTRSALSRIQTLKQAGVNPSGQSLIKPPKKDDDDDGKVMGGTPKDNAKLARDVATDGRAGMALKVFIKKPGNRATAVKRIAENLDPAQIKSAMQSPIDKEERAVYEDALRMQGGKADTEAKPAPVAQGEGQPNVPEGPDKVFVDTIMSTVTAADGRPGARGEFLKKVRAAGQKAFGNDFTMEQAKALFAKYRLKAKR